MQVPKYIDLISADGSGSTKLAIFSRLSDLFFNYDLLEQLFGFGVEKGNFAYSYYDGSYAHALIPMLLGELGLVGLLSYLIFWLFWGVKSPKVFFTVFIPFFILGLSYLPPLNETYFLVAGISMALTRKDDF
ncbi:hypothetical protein [Veronia nyctiphanis]|uniref:hypothetical protein n=1 Tax=Veronia nyctiphanis TaxID=1278244 RepID=UPI00100BB080|nr:hypothetical protein [Veronia nyctiphanis]